MSYSCEQTAWHGSKWVRLLLGIFLLGQLFTELSLRNCLETLRCAAVMASFGWKCFYLLKHWTNLVHLGARTPNFQTLSHYRNLNNTYIINTHLCFLFCVHNFDIRLLFILYIWDWYKLQRKISYKRGSIYNLSLI